MESVLFDAETDKKNYIVIIITINVERMITKYSQLTLGKSIDAITRCCDVLSFHRRFLIVSKLKFVFEFQNYPFTTHKKTFKKQYFKFNFYLIVTSPLFISFENIAHGFCRCAADAFFHARNCKSTLYFAWMVNEKTTITETHWPK